jgi:hypothetical protein
VVATAVLAPMAAFAQSWDTRDTDSLNRSTPSQNVYSTSSYIKWQMEDLDYPSGQQPDDRAVWNVKLNLNGRKGSCARLRIVTYKTAGLGLDKVSKRFPADSKTNYGYYTYCQSDGKGSKTYTGTDHLNVTLATVYGDLKNAKVSICYTKSKSVPPGGDCKNFTVKWGD